MESLDTRQRRIKMIQTLKTYLNVLKELTKITDFYVAVPVQTVMRVLCCNCRNARVFINRSHMRLKLRYA